jgi:hypothetical protein
MKNGNWKMRLGVILMIASFAPFLSIPLVPFLHVTSAVKVTITTILVVSGEVLFWGGGLLAGKELLTKYKAYLNPKNWFRRKAVVVQEEETGGQPKL